MSVERELSRKLVERFLIIRKQPIQTRDDDETEFQWGEGHLKDDETEFQWEEGHLKDVLGYKDFPQDRDQVCSFYYVSTEFFGNENVTSDDLAALLENAFNDPDEGKNMVIVVGTASKERFSSFLSSATVTQVRFEGGGGDEGSEESEGDNDTQEIDKQNGIVLTNFKIKRDKLNRFASEEVAEVSNPVSAPKTNKVLFFLTNPSTWVTLAVIIGVAAALAVAFAAPAIVVASLLGAVSLAVLIAAPLLVVHAIWAIRRDFVEERGKKLSEKWDDYTRDYDKAKKDEDYVSLIELGAKLSSLTRDNVSPAPYTFLTYLKELPTRFVTWVKSHPAEAIVIGLLIAFALTAFLVLTFGAGLAPVAATTGFLTGVFSGGFTALGAAVPGIAAIAATLAEVASVITTVVLVTIPLVVADNIRRIASSREEAKEEAKEERGRKQSYFLEPDEDEVVLTDERKLEPSAKATANVTGPSSTTTITTTLTGTGSATPPPAPSDPPPPLTSPPPPPSTTTAPQPTVVPPTVTPSVAPPTSTGGAQPTVTVPPPPPPPPLPSSMRPDAPAPTATATAAKGPGSEAPSVTTVHPSPLTQPSTTTTPSVASTATPTAATDPTKTDDKGGGPSSTPTPQNQ